MKNQYICNLDQLDNLKKFENNLIELVEFELGENMYLVCLSTKGETFKEVDLLDEINTDIKENYKETYLISCDSSEFYNQKLYKLVNRMERKLREFVYIAIIKVDIEEFQNLHNKLEKIDFGELYKILFTDENFTQGAKQIVNKSKFNQLKLILDGSFSKDEILIAIDQIEEHTIWDKINNGLSVPKLKKKFSEIKSYRNSVMHAHNINKETYEAAKDLFSEINKELDLEIKSLLTKKNQLLIGSDFTESIISSLESIKVSYSKENMDKTMESFIKALDNYKPIETEDIKRALEALSKGVSKARNWDGSFDEE